MSTLVVSSIETANAALPLSVNTGNTSIGIDLFPANGNIRIKSNQILKNDSVLGSGKQTMWIPAGALVCKATSGPAISQIFTATYSHYIRTLDFDPSTYEGVQVHIKMPKHWDKGTITYSPVWSQATTSAGAVSWNLAAVAISNSETMDAALGTPVTATSTGGTANTIYIGSESSAVTVAGSPQDDDLIVFEIGRYATGSSDTLAIDARLHGINIYYTANNITDS